LFGSVHFDLFGLGFLISISIFLRCFSFPSVHSFFLLNLFSPEANIIVIAFIFPFHSSILPFFAYSASAFIQSIKYFDCNSFIHHLPSSKSYLSFKGLACPLLLISQVGCGCASLTCEPSLDVKTNYCNCFFSTAMK